MRKDEVIYYLKMNGYTWECFEKWMAGQTVGLNSDGTIDYYIYDVMRYKE